MNPAMAFTAATPIDLAALIRLDLPLVRARCEFADSGTPGLTAELKRVLARRGRG